MLAHCPSTLLESKGHPISNAQSSGQGFASAWAPGPVPVGFCAMLTGLSGAGKTTLAQALAARWRERLHRPMEILDGDKCRETLSSELGFSDEDRDLNVARLAFVARAILGQGGAVAIAAIAPRQGARDEALRILRQAGVSCLIHVSTSLQVCEARDPKGLYAKARAGKLPGFTGLDSAYDEPRDPDLRLDLGALDVERAVDMIEAWALRARASWSGPLIIHGDGAKR
jgi:sulfate adenylyltransferase